jgi:hypothetical protein
LFVLCSTPSTARAQVTDEGAALPSQDRVWPVDPESVPRPVLEAVRATGALTVDGVVDEPAWRDAPVAGDFIQSKPRTGYPASERSEVRVLYDDQYLYIGAVLYDSDPDALIAQHLEQDFLSLNDDVFGVSLDPFLDRRNAYYFFINPLGAIRDGQAYDNSRASNTEWEGVMDVRTSVHDEGWSLEVRIPFSTLRFDPSRSEQVWGLNFLRRVRRRGEDSLWAPVALRTRIHKMAEAGTLVGLRGLPRSRNLHVTPYALGADVGGSEVASQELGTTWDGGLDVKYGLTPRLTLDATWRTDFSQVEVDQEQVNLTRFSLFFPEKRAFFVENSGTYQFGDLTERDYRLGAGPRDFTLFHSRRIGLVDGRPVPIVAGGRLTGRAAGLEIGLLNMQTESTETLEAENFTVARVRRTLFGTADVGGIFVNREATGGGEGYNRSWGVDANIRLLGNLIVHSYLAETLQPGVRSDNRAGRISAAWRGPMWDTSILFRTIGGSFEPGVGFVRRSDMRQSYATVGIHPRPPIPGTTEINPYVEVDYITDLASVLETRRLSAGLGVPFLDGSQLDIKVSDRFERLDEAFTISGQVVPVGAYDFREFELSYTASAARRLSGSIRVSGGGYFQGDRRSVGGSVIWRPSPHFAFDFGADHNVLDLEGEPFTADVFSARVDYLASTKLFLGAWVQYNDAAEEIVSNVKLNFIHAPLSDLFIVYTERRSTRLDMALDRRFTIKLTKLFAF